LGRWPFVGLQEHGPRDFAPRVLKAGH
jgi:hypothetical protein